MTKHGKKYKEAKSLIEKGKLYDLQEGLELLSKTSVTKFDSSVEIGIKTNANPRYNDQNIRSTVVLPNGTGKKVKVAVFTTEDKVADAKKNGADVAGGEELVKEIEKGNINFDVLITEPTLIRDLAKVAKILGPRGMMPSPKAGTVTNNIGETIEEIKKGRVEFKLDKSGNIHAMIGKISFGTDKLKENIETMLKTIQQNKPAGVKGKLVKKIVITTTMGPGIQIKN